MLYHYYVEARNEKCEVIAIRSGNIEFGKIENSSEYREAVKIIKKGLEEYENVFVVNFNSL